MLAVSTSPIIARYLENVPAVAISFWRMGFGALILWGVSFIKKQVPLKNENLKIDEHFSNLKIEKFDLYIFRYAILNGAVFLYKRVDLKTFLKTV